MVCQASYDSPVGKLTLAAKDDALIGLWMEGQKYFPASIAGKTVQDDGPGILSSAKKWLERYFAGERPGLSELKLAPEGSVFAKDVWTILCAIPYGETMTYGEIAKKIAARRGAERMSAQAVGGAVGHNPISIVIPCHRVVGANGSLTGYAGGFEKKIKLLAHEHAMKASFFIPNR